MSWFPLLLKVPAVIVDSMVKYAINSVLTFIVWIGVRALGGDRLAPLILNDKGGTNVYVSIEFSRRRQLDSTRSFLHEGSDSYYLVRAHTRMDDLDPTKLVYCSAELKCFGSGGESRGRITVELNPEENREFFVHVWLLGKDVKNLVMLRNH